MGTYNLPRNVKGEGRILFVFTGKSFIYAIVGGGIGLLFYGIFSLVGLNIIALFIISSKFSPPTFLVKPTPDISGILNVPIAKPTKASNTVIAIPTMFNPTRENIP